MFLSSFSINLLVVYHKCHSLTGCATHHIYSLIESEQHKSVCLLKCCLLLDVFKVSVKKI